MRSAVPKTLDTIRDDIYFQDILPRIHACRENREMYINIKLHQESLLNSGDIKGFSSEVCIRKYLFTKINSLILC